MAGCGGQTANRKSPACSPLHAGLSQNGRGESRQRPNRTFKIYWRKTAKILIGGEPKPLLLLISAVFQTTSASAKSNERAIFAECRELAKNPLVFQDAWSQSPDAIHNIVYSSHDIGQQFTQLLKYRMSAALTMVGRLRVAASVVVI